MKINNTPTAEKIVVIYDDGSTKELSKGTAFHFEGNEDDDSIRIIADMVGMEGKDLELLVSGILQLGYELGMIDHQEEQND